METSDKDKPDITCRELTASGIQELNDNDTLYSIDFRNIHEKNIRHKHAVFCENMISNVLQNKYVCVNQYATRNGNKNNNKLIVAEIGGNPGISIYKRLAETILPVNIKKLYTSIPHPDADEFCLKKELKNSYPYADYLRFNNKIKQKELLRNLTPEWNIISVEKIKKLITGENNYSEKEFYIKMNFGAGGYNVYHCSELKNMNVQTLNKYILWYKETAVEGTPKSVQIYRKSSGEYILFGFTEMKIINKKSYAGARIKKISLLSPAILPQIEAALKRLDCMLNNYQGFMGIDFIENENKIWVLEANVRVSMATFATLKLNETNKDYMNFYRLTQEWEV